ncbi:tyrosine--tRNA ligase [Halalkalicoccus jeotgali]|uniref:Tyrosine--tRNA ligase n=1 Tax=Halalkalicoccus jeotgali (strain DSM 18796 / CECT 7217 / JCM 14584 / KCTC 4019 / B3) TaxID=795797 RepID=D8J409_HALJB|nr:tyrosine--tRNA ligase [Halalkalicoccus jeotgali]ADJ15401.1 tyrosyl-tRNA synthetase [Halalkalicoccus jeotgali B3]ELY35823.1 tyrosyl-tRNA ligase [Halalkalicoccus jeotgali B3]
MNTAERKRLVTRHTEEVITEEELETLLEEPDPSIYIGYAPTGEMHIGHFTTIRKLADFLEAGIDVTVLIADLHAHLDDEKSPFELLEARSAYYEAAIEAMVEASGADPGDIEFVRGTEFELEEPYTLELYRLLADTTLRRAQRAGSEVVRQSENPKLGGLVYTLMQSLDVAALDADIAYGGIDQRGIYMLAREILPEHGHEKPLCLFAPLLSGLSGGKMSASEAGSKVNLTDDPETVGEKIDGAYCPQGEREENGVLEYLDHLVFPILEEDGEPFVIERPEQYGGDVVYENYGDLEADFLEGELHPQDLKGATGEAIAEIIAPIRERFEAEPDLLARAYPDQED